MKKFTISLVLGLFCLHFPAIAQENIAANSGQQAIQTGQTVPDVSITDIHNYKAKTASLSDFKGKLLILDFWATWCSPCVAMIPRMDSLQKQFGDKIQFLSVTYQKATEVMPFLEKLEKQKGRHFDLPVVVEDKELHKLFPHRTLPHYVWIGADGKAKAITESTELTSANIREIIEGQRALLTNKRQYMGQKYNPYQPLFSIASHFGKDHILVRSVLSGFNEDIAGGGSYVDVANQDSIYFRRITLYNVSMPRLFQIAAGGSKPFSWNRTIIKAKDLSKLRSAASGQAYRDWLKDGNGYCYELVVPAGKADKAYEIMWNDLSNYFTDYRIEIHNEEMDCLALQSTGDYSKVISKGGVPGSEFSFTGCTITNRKFGLSLLVNQLATLYMQTLATPILNETSLEEPVDLKIDAPLNNVEAVNKALSAYGLRLVNVKRKLEVLIISDRPTATQSSIN